MFSELQTLFNFKSFIKMKQISFILIALVSAFCISCSNDPKVEGEFVKAVDEAVAKFENAKTIEDIQAFATEMEKISQNEEFSNLRETGAAKEAAEKLAKAVESMEEKMQEVTSNMLNNALGGEKEPAEEAPAE